MPMTRRQLHQTEIDYQHFLPAMSHVTDVSELPKHYDSARCELCDTQGNRKKMIGYVCPQKPEAPTGRWKWTNLKVCRNGRGCRGRYYDAKAR